MDFVHDQPSKGDKISLLTVAGVFARDLFAIEVGLRLRSEDVVRVLSRLVWLPGRPETVFCENGAEFTGQIIDPWAHHHSGRMDFSRPGTPTDNAHIESFNSTLRDEFLNGN